MKSKLLAALLLILPLAGHGEIITLKTSGNHHAEANFLAGDPDKKAVLILHGFLQTGTFSTVKRLSDTLNEAGYSVLTPTLTLGIDKRRQSLPCEALHLHSTDSDTAEISQWVDWLHHKTARNVTLIGHSAGSITLMNYLQTAGTSKIDNAILISMAPFADNDNPIDANQVKKARAEIANGQDNMADYTLSFCKTYPTTSSAFLSYHDWNQEKLSNLAIRFSEMIDVIIGTGDKRLSQPWRDLLAAKQVPVTYIEGANHFFDQAHEFDLSDAVENLLE